MIRALGLFSAKRTKLAYAKLPYTLNGILILLGVFIIIAMSAVWIVFEEFTAFTDYTQQWIEFNFFIYYWDKLTITRVYLSFIHIYGGVILAIAAMQIHGLRKKNLNLLHLAPLLLIFVAVITVLGGICWLIVTAVNYNEGFLATGGFIFERMRFKGNVWKDLIYRESSFRLVTENRVPYKAPIIKIWVFQRQRDFSCCGWNSYMDYTRGNFTDLPESCCKQRQRVYGCANDFLHIDRTEVINTRGCRDVMYPWYRSGFIENIIMSIIGLAIGAFEFFAYSVNRKEYYKLLDDLDDMRKPMMNTTMSMSTINSKGSAGIASGTGHIINFGPRSSKYPSQQRFYNQNTPSMGGESFIGSNSATQLPQLMSDPNNFVNPLQSVQNSSGRFPPFSNRTRNNNYNSTPTDRDFITEQE